MLIVAAYRENKFGDQGINFSFGDASNNKQKNKKVLCCHRRVSGVQNATAHAKLLECCCTSPF